MESPQQLQEAAAQQVARIKAIAGAALKKAQQPEPDAPQLPEAKRARKRRTVDALK